MSLCLCACTYACTCESVRVSGSVYVVICMWVPSCLFLQDGGGAMAGFVAASQLLVSDAET